MKWNPFSKHQHSSGRSDRQSATRQTAETSSSGGSRPRTRDTQGVSRPTPTEASQAPFRSTPTGELILETIGLLTEIATGFGCSEGSPRNALTILRQNGSRVTSACAAQRLGLNAFLNRLNDIAVRPTGEVWRGLGNAERKAISDTLSTLSGDPDPSISNAAKCLYNHLRPESLYTITTRPVEHLAPVVPDSSPGRADARSVNSAETLHGDPSPQPSQLSGDTLHP